MCVPFLQDGVVGQLAAAVVRGDRLNYAEVRGVAGASDHTVQLTGRLETIGQFRLPGATHLTG